MQKADIEFFDEYKKLDRLCADVYSFSSGITDYITRMENNSEKGRSLVTDWDRDYKMLKHVRWVRNQIAHESENCKMSEASDIKSVKDFYNRVSAGKDPLALLESGNGSFLKRLFMKMKTSGRRKQKSGGRHRKSRSWGKLAMLLVLIAVAVILIILFF